MPTANRLFNLTNLLDADHLDEDKPRFRVHCEEGGDAGGEDADGSATPGRDDDCRCVVIAAAIA